MLVLAASGYVASGRLTALDLRALLDEMASLTPVQMVGALLAVLLAFVAVAGQERAVVGHMGIDLDKGRGARAAMAAAAVSQTAGFGPVVGAIIRRRLLPELGLGQSFAISAGMALGFFAGLGLLALTCFALVPDMPHQGLARVLLVLGVLGAVAIALLPLRPFGRRMPNLIVMARFLGWLALDVTSLGTALWFLLPEGVAFPFLDLLPVFFIAVGIGLASGSPGGAGPFEATLLTNAPEGEAAGLLAGILAFRAIAYALPALCGVIWALAAPRRAEPLRNVPVLRTLSDARLRALPMAEAQLVRQNSLHLIAPQGGALWLSGALGHARVVLGAPLNSAALRPALANLASLARSEQRLPCLYKAPARLAATARRAGWRALPVAREAVLNPLTFSTAGAERARLRRKLTHARKGGITVQMPQTPPLPQMDLVGASWAKSGHREMGFSMGRWDAGYVRHQRVFTAHAKDGTLCAFVTFHTAQGEWTLDLIRAVDRCPDGTIYALICHALEQAKAEGVGRLSLAAVPVSDLGLRGLAGRLAQRATQRSNGLAQFKSAFAPKWETRYIAAKGWLAIGLAAFEITRAIHRPAPLTAQSPKPLRQSVQDLAAQLRRRHRKHDAGDVMGGDIDHTQVQA